MRDGSRTGLFLLAAFSLVLEEAVLCAVALMDFADTGVGGCVVGGEMN